jgi:hypothetical protein
MFGNWALTAFEPLLNRFNQFVNSNAFGVLAGHAMWFVNLFIAGMSLMFDALEWIYNGVGMVGQFFQANWSWIAPILTVIAAVLGTIGAILAWLAIEWVVLQASIWIATTAQWAFNTAMAAFPGTWILLAFVAVIALVVYALYAWGDQTAAVVGFISGLFTALVAGVYNKFAFMWNILVSFAEFLINVFIDPKYAVDKLFYDLSMNFLQVMYNMAVSAEGFAGSFATTMYGAINKVLGGINSLIGAMNNIPGFDIPKLNLIDESKLNFASNKVAGLMKSLEGMKPVSARGVVDFSGAKMDQINYKDTFMKGDQVGRNISNSATKGLNSIVDKAKGLFNPNQNGKNPNPFKNPLLGDLAPPNPTGGKLDKIGKIDDKINIADEDLKVFRELAEIKSIQNIITLTPTVQLQGTVVREEADLDKLTAQIESKMINEINESAEGAFS